MLEHLFGSKTRVRMLRLFLSNPSESYFVRELTRRVDAQINAVRHELDNLVEMGLLEVVDSDENRDDEEETIMTGGRKYFRLNTAAHLYPELKALFDKSRIVVEKDFVKRIAQIGQVQYLALTGFFVSDDTVNTDMLLVGKINKEKFVPLVRQFEQEVGREINFTLMSPQEFKYRRDVTDRFLYGILESRKIVLIDMVSERVGDAALVRISL
jgi:DNA-binding transcriptional ArsR family regulator